MNNKQSFLDFHSWFMSLSNPSHLEKYVRELAEYRFEHPIISDDFKNISSMERNLKTGKYENEVFDVDDDLMRQANRFISNPQQRIYPYLKNKDHVEQLLAATRGAVLSIRRSDFYNQFQAYHRSVAIIGVLLRDIRDHWEKPLKTVGKTNKGDIGSMKRKAHELIDESYEKILELGSHEEAISYLEDKYEGFNWMGNKELFKKNGEPNKSQLSLALFEIGRLRWGKDTPSDEYIRKLFP